ncbi:MAG: SEC-C metal-binding domain-containing protein [bacterium]
MYLVENLKEKIQELIENLENFVKIDEHIKQDYLKNMGQEQKTVPLSYIFDKRFENQKKTVVDLYLENNSELSEEEKEILFEINKSRSSIFEIKKIIKEKFELYDLVNEKLYKVKTFLRAVDLRRVIPGYYLTCRIFNFKNEYYLVSLESCLSSLDKQKVYNSAITTLLTKPELLYEDNNEKLDEIEQAIVSMDLKFKEYFKRDEIITTNQHTDALLKGFNSLIENSNNSEQIEDVDSLIHLPEKFAYFYVDEISNTRYNIAEAAKKNFSSHKKVYDVGIMFDANFGMIVLPFYGTFKQIFAVEDYKSIENYKDCILDYFKSEKIPPNPILRVYNENKENFIKIVSEVFELQEPLNVEEFLHKYKEDYFARKRFSPPTILFMSNTFNELVEILEEEKSNNDSTKKIGRNDPCICGSNKKYKKCCLK